MPAIQLFRQALRDCQVSDEVVAQIMEGYEDVTDNSKKPKKAAFMTQAMQRMDALLDPAVSHAVRDACACSKGGWRLKAVQKVAQEYAGRPLEDRLRALGEVRYMGKPTLNADGDIVGGVGDRGGFQCPCPVFSNSGHQGPVSLTYCYCCAGHLRFHYQIALGVKLATKAVLSSALASEGTEPCRFVYEIVA